MDRNATDLLSSSQLNSKPTVYNCQRCLVENHVDNRQCSHCEQRRLGEGFWDVSALSATYKISPTPRLNRENTITIEPLGFADLNGQHAYEVCPEMPTREQSLRLLGLSGLSSLSSDFGRVIQIMNGLLLVNVYNDNGASGGPVLDRLGRLAGVMSCVNPDETGKAYIEPIGNFTSLLQSHYFFNNRHDPLTCSFCVEQPLVRDKFCWRG